MLLKVENGCRWEMKVMGNKVRVIRCKCLIGLWHLNAIGFVAHPTHPACLDHLPFCVHFPSRVD